MSLRLRFVLLTLGLVTLVGVTLSALYLKTLVDFYSDETQSRADLVNKQISDFLIGEISAHVATLTPEESALQVPDQWAHIIATDPDVTRNLLRAFNVSPSIVEINVADHGDRILASSSPNSVGTILRREQPFSDWSRLPWYLRAYDLMHLPTTKNWEISPSPIGTDASPDPVLQIQVIYSSALGGPKFLTNRLEGLATALGIALLVSLIVALLATHSALRPLRRIERTIDGIVQGNFQASEKRGSLGKEFQAVESKLDLLGQRIARASMDDSGIHKGLDVLVERVARQFDVAQRLSAISRLSSGVAHEIKNPLNAILLRLDLLKVRLGDTDEEIAAELAVLSKEVLRLNRVVTTFLDFSRPLEVHYEDLDLAALASDVAELVRPQAALASISVECQVPKEPAAMRGDPDLLKQAILNLVTNAVEAMSATGGRLRVSVARQEDNWILEVADTGPGIPPERRDQVFQLYYTSKPTGSGIGLAMTYRAAQLHNGTISLTSEPGRGATFRLEFPAAVTHA